MGNKPSSADADAVAARYPPLQRLLAQCDGAGAAAGNLDARGRPQKLNRAARRVRDAIAPKLARRLAACDAAGARVLRRQAPPLEDGKLTLTQDGKLAGHVRFVCVSDTHGHHRRMALPPGDVLVHCGDVVGNYGGKCDLAGQWQDFVRWLHEQSPRYARIVFIAGNHDTLLDFAHYGGTPAARAAAATLKASSGGGGGGGGDGDGVLGLPDNCIYLCNNGCTFRGLRLWGCPATPSREELYRKRYYSDAFETYAAAREQLYAAIPGTTDVLLTHAPAAGSGLCGRPVGDGLLARRLRALPNLRFHVCGHDHDHLGFALGNKKTTSKTKQAKKTKAKAKAKRWVRGGDDGEWVAGAGAEGADAPHAAAAADDDGSVRSDDGGDSDGGGGNGRPPLVHVNAAQLTVLRAFPEGGGCALVFDVPVPARCPTPADDDD